MPAQVVPDNLKSGVVKACLYDPEINRTYADMAAHYGTAIVPARPRKPRDKAKVGSPSRLSSVGSWPACATAASSRWPN